MDMRCTLCMDRLARGVLTGKNGRPACNAFTAGCVWFKKDQVERHFEILHSNDSTSKVVMGPLEKSLYTSIEMEEKRVQIIFMECYYMASHYGALNEIKERCLYTARNGWLPDLPNRLHLEKATKRGPPSFFCLN